MVAAQLIFECQVTLVYLVDFLRESLILVVLKELILLVLLGDLLSCTLPVDNVLQMLANLRNVLSLVAERGGQPQLALCLLDNLL